MLLLKYDFWVPFTTLLSIHMYVLSSCNVNILRLVFSHLKIVFSFFIPLTLIISEAVSDKCHLIHWYYKYKYYRGLHVAGL